MVVLPSVSIQSHNSIFKKFAEEEGEIPSKRPNKFDDLI
jgi:hypothetical protein